VRLALSEGNLGAIEGLGVAVPRYDRASLAPRILHLGVGGFHRAHMALYTDELAAAGGDWGIRGVGLLEADRRMAEALRGQNHLYTLIERDSDGSQARVIGSIVDYALSVGDVGAFAALVADPHLAILSMTITEGGYSLAAENPTLEAIASALEARRVAGEAPLTILSCDNLPGNGKVAGTAIRSVCESRGPELARYVAESCSFPNSMVDRITPQTADADRAWLSEEIGIDDAWPVVAEPFRQWVIEDDFAAGRPRYEEVGVLFTDRVHDWELYKLRMLNASHSCMAYLMAIAGVTYVDEAMAITSLRSYLERFLADEAIPTLAEIPGHPAAEYASTVLHRFENTGVRDQIARLCIDGTAKFPSFLIPTIERQLERGGPVEYAALALAGWARYLAVTPAPERAPDPRGERAAALAGQSLDDPLGFLELEEVFTPALRESSRYRDSFANASRSLAENGPLGAIERLLG
jgi:mannitol 2-dehydrogenase